MNPTDKTILPPELYDTLSNLKTDIFRSLNSVKIGKITIFDEVKKTAEVQILFKRILPDQTIQSYPLLLNCPIFTLQGGGAAIQMPIAVGDHCLILFSDRNIDFWFKTSSEGAPFDSRCHDLSDGIALVGLNALTSDLEDYADDEVKLTYADSRISIKDTGMIQILSSTTGEVSINNSGLIKIASPATDLRTAIEGLIDVIKAITDANNVPLSSTSIAALEAYKIVFQGLLE